MANDPNRDLLPVKEDSKTVKGISCKSSNITLSKLSRSEIEDRFLRLVDEQTHLKKLANSQEEKIKRLGTKLLRLINDKKCDKRFQEGSKETEDLQLRIIELEHENYALKDKNTVLKQQLSSHSRHLSTQRSPNRSNHSSPLITLRQSAPPTHREIVYDSTTKSTTAEMQLQEAEAHIRDLNEEIKALHNKIDFLQQNVEKNSLDSRKIKVSENIELIRLQRSLKQQAIQISSLQAQIKNSENSQKLLKDELMKAHKENDEALHVISTKQNEILSLCNKLEEKNLNRLEEDELKQRINDLLQERDCLKERSEYLMKSISEKCEESNKIKELEQQLLQEKWKKEKLKEQDFKHSCEESPPCILSDKTKTINQSQQTDVIEKKDAGNVAGEFSEDSQCSCHKCNLFLSICKCSQESFLNADSSTETEPSESLRGRLEREPEPESKSKNGWSEGKSVAEKVKLEREVEFLREMLRSQTARCEAQQTEIKRLMYELKLNERKCNETLEKLDWHLRIFQAYEIKELENMIKAKQSVKKEEVDVAIVAEPAPAEVSPASPAVAAVAPPVPAKRESLTTKSESISTSSQQTSVAKSERSSGKVTSNENIRASKYRDFVYQKRKRSLDENPSVASLRIDFPVSMTPEKEYSANFGTKTSHIIIFSLGSSFDKAFISATAKTKAPISEVTDFKAQYKITNFKGPDNAVACATFPHSPCLLRFPEVSLSAPTQSSSRFVDQKFLDSSDEELDKNNVFPPTFARKSDQREEEPATKTHKGSSSKEWSKLRYKAPKSSVLLRTSSASWNSKNTAELVPSERQSKSGDLTSGSIRDADVVTIKIFWLKVEPSSSLWRNNEVEMLFIDFTFLDVNGAETETPQSLPKPKHPDELCRFNFSQTLELSENKKEMLKSLLKKPESIVILFQVVSDSETFDDKNGECEDLGMATVTASDFVEYCNEGSFQIPVRNVDNTKEVIGTLTVGLEATPDLLKMKH